MARQRGFMWILFRTARAKSLLALMATHLYSAKKTKPIHSVIDIIKYISNTIFVFDY